MGLSSVPMGFWWQYLAEFWTGMILVWKDVAYFSYFKNVPKYYSSGKEILPTR